jgi:hypothetical protein
MTVIERIEVSIPPEKANRWVESGLGWDRPFEQAFGKDWYIEAINVRDGVYLATLVSCRPPTALEIVSQWRNN